jgi:hypothetical protein
VTQPSRNEAVTILDEGQGLLRHVLVGLTEEQLVEPRTIGGGDWSAKDLIGHLETWERLALIALDEWRLGRRPTIEDTLASPTGVDDLIAAKVEQKRAHPLEVVQGDADTTHVELTEEIKRMSDQEWSAKASYETLSNRRHRLGSLLGSILGAPQRPFGHAFAHLPDLESYVTSLR